MTSGIYPLTLNQPHFVCISVKNISTILVSADRQVKALSSTVQAQLLTYLLTPRSRVLLEKLTGFAANQEIPRILRLAKPPSWRTTTFRLSATAYSIYSQLPSISEAVPPSATRGRAMPWWQGPSNTGSKRNYMLANATAATELVSHSSANIL